MECLLDLTHDQRRQIGRIRFQPHAADEREQDFARVVFLPEEPLIEPLPRTIAIAQPRDTGCEQREIDGRAARQDLGEVLLQ